MSILSWSYLLLSGGSSIFLWLFSRHGRKITVLLVNLVFLYLLRANPMDWIYVTVLSIWTWLFAKHGKNKSVFVLSILVPVLGLCWYKYSGYLTGRGVAMPLGLSFYTFKAISYLADVRKEKCTARDLISVFDYLVFFPTFMAGPINRAEPFFQELDAPLVFDYRDQKNGCVQAGLGLFEKLVIADELSALVKAHLDNPELNGWYTVLGIVLYTFQIYADFDAYSNVAIGTARMMGFHLKRNFNVPYLSSSIKEFWRRWHMSLSSWLTDYIYIPLGGNRKGTARKYLNTLIVFLVSGLWHGSTLMFLIWGLGHGVLSIAEDFLRNHIRLKANWFWKILGILINFAFVSLLWVFFRASSMQEAFSILARAAQCIHASPFTMKASTVEIPQNEWYWGMILVGLLILTDCFRYRKDRIEWLADQNFLVRWLIYFVIMVTAIIFGVYGPGYHPEDFIYVTF